MCSTCDCDKKPIRDEVQNGPSESSSKLVACRKCGSDKPIIILDKVHLECQDCFLESCNRKTRSTIGKSKLLKNNDSILIAHSGGASSTALLDLIQRSIEYDTRREQKFRPSILHIDTQSVIGCLDPKNRLSRLKALLEYTNRQFPKWPLYWTTLELHPTLATNCDSTTSKVDPCYMQFNPDDDFELISNRLLTNLEAQNSFTSTISRLDNLTDQLHYVKDCTMEMIDKVACHLNSTFANHEDRFKFVFSGAGANRLANNLMADVIRGVGSTIHDTVSICDRRAKVPILRPMRDFSKKEVAFYLKTRGLQVFIQQNLATLAGPKASIQSVTESFLNKLYVDYPSTYSTLLRTGNKMQTQ